MTQTARGNMRTLKVAALVFWLITSSVSASPCSLANQISLHLVQKFCFEELRTSPEVAHFPWLLGEKLSEKDLALWRIVEEMNRKQIEAFNKGDLLGVARIYADDATIYFPHYQSKQGRKIHGRAAIDKYWLAIEKPKAWKLEIVEVGGTKDAIWEIGKSTLTEEFDGKDSTYVGDFVVIWKRQTDGTYRIHTDIYN